MQFELLNEDETIRIMSCLNQFVKKNKNEKIFTITVWFPKDANKVFNSYTHENGFLIFDKDEFEYSNRFLINKVKNIKKKKLIPIEIIKNGVCLFYALPKESIMEEKDLRNVIMLVSEEEIPELDKFYI